MKQRTIKTILAVDCGMATTNLFFMAKRNQVHHLIATATTPTTTPDINPCLVTAIKQLQTETGHRFLNRNDKLIKPQTIKNQGVDALVIATSVAEPIKIVLAGLTHDVSLEYAQHAISTTYAETSCQITLSGRDARPTRETGTTKHAFSESDFIIIVGGVDGGNTSGIIELTKNIRASLELVPVENRPQIIYAGNNRFRSHVANVLSDLASFKSLDNITHHNLHGIPHELDKFYHARKIHPILTDWQTDVEIATAKSYSQAIYYIGQSYKAKILGVDVGSKTTTIAMNRHDTMSTVQQGDFQNHVTCTDIGVGLSLDSLLKQSSLEKIYRWLPFEMEVTNLSDFLRVKKQHPHTIPQSHGFQLLELAIVREALRTIMVKVRKTWSVKAKALAPQRWLNFDLIVVGGQALTQVNDLALSVLTILDGLEPIGICDIMCDNIGVLNILGGIANIQPLAAAQVTDSLLDSSSVLNKIGVIVAPVGIGKIGSTALHVHVIFDHKREPLMLDISFGTVHVIPLGIGEKAKLDLHPTKKFDLKGTGKFVGKRVVAKVEGGTLGIIIDARGRPISMSRDDVKRRKQIQTWLGQLGCMLEFQPEKDIDTWIHARQHNVEQAKTLFYQLNTYCTEITHRVKILKHILDEIYEE